MPDPVTPPAPAAPAGPKTPLEPGAPPPAPTPTPAPTPAPAAPPKPGEPAPPAAPEAKWPDNWREGYAGNDATKMEVLKRYASPQAALDALFAAKERITKGLTMGLPADATPEQVAEYRKAHGIPDKPEGYKLTLSEGRVVGEADKPIIDQLLKSAHEMNVKPEVASKFVDFYYQQQEAAIAQREELDATQRTETEEALRQEYGQEYTRN